MESPTEPSGAGTVSLVDFARTIRRRWRSAVAALLVVLAVTAVAYELTPPQYTGSAAVRIAPVADSPGSTASIKDVSTTTETRIVTSSSVASRAQSILGTQQSLGELLGQVSATAPLDSLIISISYTADTATAAARVANAFAKAYLDYRASVAQDAIDVRVALLTGRINSLNSQYQDLSKEIDGTKDAAARSDLATRQRSVRSQIDNLSDQRTQLETLTVVPGQIVGEAVPPKSKSAPKPSIFGVAGLVLGLLAGLLLALVREQRDDRVANAAELERLLGAPVLGVVPQRQRGGEVWSGAEVPGEGETIRAVTAKLLSHAQEASRVLLVTPRREEDEATAIVPARVAVSLAATGTETVLAAPAQAVAALQRRLSRGTGERDGTEPGEAVPVPGHDLLRIMSLGEETDVRRFRQVSDSIPQLSEAVDAVVIDAVNVADQSSLLLLSRQARLVVLVATIGQLQRAEIASLVHELAQVDRRIDAAIAVAAAPRARLRHRANASAHPEETPLRILPTETVRAGGSK